DISIVAARRFGGGEGFSLGIKLDYLTQRTSFASESQGNFDEALNNYSRFRSEKSQRNLDRARLTVGFARQLTTDKKLGDFYRYGKLSEGITPKGYSDTCKLIECLRDDFLVDVNSLDQISSEAGVLFRGSINRRLFYGFDGGLFIRRRSHAGTEDVMRFIEDQLGRETVREFEGSGVRSKLDIAGKSFRGGGGIGYALGQSTVLSIDLSGGTER